ncbi:MAG: DNA methyltransferase [Anaerolineae bacterium]|nr:DNA methyltransferase [Anaerolineae bacterium]
MKRYIEKDFPIERLNILALREGNSKRPIYRMHKWWARRLGSVFRMLLLTVFADVETPENKLWRRFYHGDGLSDPIVLDPFMGGGTTLVEALRLNCRVIGVDINPVAWFITKKEIEPVDLANLDAAFARLEKAVGKRIRYYYRTTCSKGHPAEVMYIFWVKSLPCASCGKTIDLWPNNWVSRRPERWMVVCPACDFIFPVPPHSEKATCPDCAKAFKPASKTSGYGRFHCPHCHHVETHLDAVARLGGPIPARMYGLEYYCPVCDARGYKRADRADHDLFDEAQARFEALRETLLFPRQHIPSDGRSDPRPVNHGYTHFWHLFNSRQLLCLSFLLEGILAEPDRNLRELLLLAFSDALDSNNMFCKYEIDYHKISLLFGLHAYHPIERPTENNVWGTRYGRGTFKRCYEKVRRGKAYSVRVYERAFDDQGPHGVITGERIEGSLVKAFDELLAGQGKALLRCADSSSLAFVPDESVDAVITDPPYFANVMYSELADFFYVWLRLGLANDYAWFQPEHSRREEELVQNVKEGKGEYDFTSGLTSIWQECHRVLKDDGMLAFTFHHSEVSAWAAVGRSLLDAGFVVTAAPFVRSEGKSGFHSETGNIKYDVILVCRKRLEQQAFAARWSELLPGIIDAAQMWLRRTQAPKMALNTGDALTALMGQALVAYTTHWPGISTDAGFPLPIEGAFQVVAPLAETLLPRASAPPSNRPGQLTLFESAPPYQVAPSAD